MNLQIRQRLELAKGYEVIRRYFVINSFDGVLTVIGVLIGAHASDSIYPQVIIKITLAAGIAMFISGAFATFATEKAERDKSLKELEQAMMTDLQESMIQKANATTTLISSLVDGFSQLLAMIVVISPFFFTKFITPLNAFYISIGLALVTLFGLGIFLGRISKQKVIISGLKMMGIGIIAVVLISLLDLF